MSIKLNFSAFGASTAARLASWLAGLFSLTLVAGELIAAQALAQASAISDAVDIFEPVKDGFPAIRIPSLIRADDGALLAFAEGRQGGDHSGNVLLLKRSEDEGNSWGPAIVLDQRADQALNNPQAVVLDSGRVLLMYQANRLGERKAATGFGPDSYSVWLLASDDGGKTWFPPRDVTRQTRRETSTSVASGPGIGILLKHQGFAGRIVMPMNEGPYGDWRVYAAISDDRGETWRLGECAPTGDFGGMANEVQMVELDDGSLLLNARIQGGSHCRKQARSVDGGMTWSELEDHRQLVDPVCQASLLGSPRPSREKALTPAAHGQVGEAARDESGDSPTTRIYFLNPASESQRRGGALRWSDDGGSTWSDPVTVWPGRFAYSCMTSLSNGKLGIAFERDGYAAISFLTVDPKIIESAIDAAK